MPVIGAVTIGQSPRDDVLPEVMSLLPAQTQVIERGALDDLGGGQIAGLAPPEGEAVLVSRLRDGREVTLAEAGVLPLVQEAVDRVRADGAGLVAVLCTGSLSGLRCPAPLLMPGPVTRGLVAALTGARLGVVVPAAGQAAAAAQQWAGAAGQVRVECASPYAATDDLAEASRALAAWHADLVVLDCLGFGRAAQRLARRFLEVPVILPRLALAGAIAALL
jgi:protein AroM